MATTKQIAAVKHQQSKGLIHGDVEAEKLSTDEASKLLSDSGYKNGSVEGAAKVTEKTEKKSDIEGIRFGLACKLVAQNYNNINKKFWMMDSFDKDVHQAYDALAEAQDTYRGS